MYGVRSHSPVEVYFQWQEKGQETAGQRISRHVAGAPGRLLVYRENNPTLAAVDTVGWVFHPHHDPDPVATAVLAFVDGLTVEFLLDFARRAAADDLAEAQSQVKALSRELEMGRDWVAACQLMEAALMFTDPEHVKVGLALVPDWVGTPDELVLAVLAVTRPAGCRHAMTTPAGGHVSKCSPMTGVSASVLRRHPSRLGAEGRLLGPDISNRYRRG